MKKNVIRATSLLIGIMLFVSTGMTACGKKETPAPKNTVEKTVDPYAKPLPLSLMHYGDKTGAVPSTEEAAVKKMKERYNIDLKIDFIDKASYVEKLNVMIAAGEYGDVIFFNDRQKMSSASASGLIVPITDIVKNDPVWKKVNPVFLKGGTIKGEQYFLPTTQAIPTVFNYRADWAKKLNIKTPTNADELYAMLHAFSKKDPDGNGKDDTFGITMQGDFKNSDSLWKLFLPTLPLDLGLYFDNKSESVKSIYSLNDDMKVALVWLNKAYKEGVLDKEFIFAKNTDTENKFVTGKVGVWMYGAHWITTRYEKLKANFADVDITAIPIFKGKYGTAYSSTDEGVTEGYFLTKKCTDKDRGMKFLSYWSGPEGIKDRVQGQDGKDFKVENGKLTWLNEDARKAYNPGSIATSVHEMKLDEPVPVLEKALQNTKGYDINVGVTSIKAESAIYKSKAADLNKLASETLLKIIIGETPVEKYEDFLTQMKKAGLDEVLADINKIYKSK